MSPWNSGPNFEEDQGSQVISFALGQVVKMHALDQYQFLCLKMVPLYFFTPTIQVFPGLWVVLPLENLKWVTWTWSGTFPGISCTVRFVSFSASSRFSICLLWKAAQNDLFLLNIETLDLSPCNKTYSFQYSKIVDWFSNKCHNPNWASFLLANQDTSQSSSILKTNLEKIYIEHFPKTNKNCTRGG